MSRRRPLPVPLDAAALRALALNYVGRYATTRARLAAYLARKLRERGWQGPSPDIDGLVSRIAELGYVDDRQYAQIRAAALTRRGYGRRRIALALRGAGVAADDQDDALDDSDAGATDSALAFARRRRFGPWATGQADAPMRRRQVAAMMRAGHSPTLSRRIVETPIGTTFDPDL